MDIFLVRHGEAAASWGQEPDPGLSELGQQQAETTALELQALIASDVQLLSSPLLRARETADALAAKLQASVAINAVYSEIPSPVPLAERQDWLRGFMKQQWQQQPASLQAWREAMVQGLLALDHPTVVFSHFLVMNTLVGHVQGRDETLCFWPDNAAVVRLRRTVDGLEIVDLGRQMSTVVN
jgi:broad specificity phosphatase PhoE